MHEGLYIYTYIPTCITGPGTRDKHVGPWAPGPCPLAPGPWPLAPGPGPRALGPEARAQGPGFGALGPRPGIALNMEGGREVASPRSRRGSSLSSNSEFDF